MLSLIIFSNILSINYIENINILILNRYKNISWCTFLHTFGLAGLVVTMPLFGTNDITAEVDKNVVMKRS